MKQSNSGGSNRRHRNPRRNNNNGRSGGGGGNSSQRGKSRGNAMQNYERYTNGARDALSNGDYIEAERRFQFAEHYYRVAEAAGAIKKSHAPAPTPSSAAQKEPEKPSVDKVKNGADNAMDNFDESALPSFLNAPISDEDMVPASKKGGDAAKKSKKEPASA